MPRLPVVAALSRQRATITRLEVRCFFRIFAYGFHRLSFDLLVWEFVSGNRWGCELRMGWVRPLFRHKVQVPADKQAVEILVFSPVFSAGLRLVLLEMRQCDREGLLTTEGMVTAF